MLSIIGSVVAVVLAVVAPIVAGWWVGHPGISHVFDRCPPAAVVGHRTHHK